MGRSSNPKNVVREIRRRMRRNHAAEKNIHIVVEGLMGEQSFAELCRKEVIQPTQYYIWSKEFFEAGMRRLASNTSI